MKEEIEKVIKKLLKKVEESENVIEAQGWARAADTLSALRRDS